MDLGGGLFSRSFHQKYESLDDIYQGKRRTWNRRGQETCLSCPGQIWRRYAILLSTLRTTWDEISVLLASIKRRGRKLIPTCYIMTGLGCWSWTTVSCGVVEFSPSLLFVTNFSLVLETFSCPARFASHEVQQFKIPESFLFVVSDPTIPSGISYYLWNILHYLEPVIASLPLFQGSTLKW